MSEIIKLSGCREWLRELKQSKDLRKKFPEMTEFSRANLFRMQKFYSSAENFVAQF